MSRSSRVLAGLLMLASGAAASQPAAVMLSAPGARPGTVFRPQRGPAVGPRPFVFGKGRSIVDGVILGAGSIETDAPAFADETPAAGAAPAESPLIPTGGGARLFPVIDAPVPCVRPMVIVLTQSRHREARRPRVIYGAPPCGYGDR